MIPRGSTWTMKLAMYIIFPFIQNFPLTCHIFHWEWKNTAPSCVLLSYLLILLLFKNNFPWLMCYCWMLIIDLLMLTSCLTAYGWIRRKNFTKRLISVVQLLELELYVQMLMLRLQVPIVIQSSSVMLYGLPKWRAVT